MSLYAYVSPKHRKRILRAKLPVQKPRMRRYLLLDVLRGARVSECAFIVLVVVFQYGYRRRARRPQLDTYGKQKRTGVVRTSQLPLRIAMMLRSAMTMMWSTICVCCSPPMLHDYVKPTRPRVLNGSFARMSNWGCLINL